MIKSWFSSHAAGVQITVKVTPKSSKNAIDAIIKDADGSEVLKLRVTAPPDKGKANAAVLRLMADTWKLPVSSLSVVSGETGRKKIIHINGNTQYLTDMLEHFHKALSD